MCVEMCFEFQLVELENLKVCDFGVLGIERFENRDYIVESGFD